MASIIKSDNGVSSGITGIVQSADSSGQLVLQTTTSGGTATTAVTIDNTQKVTFANSIGFGSNAGITFNNSSALTNSLLNDYETGTFTPTLSVGSGALSSYSTSGRYVKVGNLVSVWMNYNIINNGTGASTASFGGLPFSTNATSGSCGVSRVAGTTGNTCAANIPGNATVGNLWTYNNSYPWATGATGDIFLSYTV